MFIRVQVRIVLDIFIVTSCISLLGRFTSWQSVIIVLCANCGFTELHIVLSQSSYQYIVFFYKYIHTYCTLAVGAPKEKSIPISPVPIHVFVIKFVSLFFFLNVFRRNEHETTLEHSP